MALLPAFRRLAIHQGGPSERVLCVADDLNGDGTPEIIIGARAPRAELFWLGRNPAESGDLADTWIPHPIDSNFTTLEAGGALADIDGDGDLDLIAGQDARGDRLFWWECPATPEAPWTRREILRMPANKSHDQLVTDLDGDGRLEVYFWNQGAGILCCIPVPDDPRVSPWPGLQVIATDLVEEGLAVGDVDGDGQLELIAGQSWYRRAPDGTWQRYPYAEGYVSPKVVAADFDGDGRAEIALAEGDASLNGRAYGRVAWFKPGATIEALWEVELLHDRLLDPHSLQVADWAANGRPDLFVGEMGLPDGRNPHPPAQRIFVNEGGTFSEHLFDHGPGTHESKVIAIGGHLGIVAKPFRVLRSQVPREPEVDTIYLWLPW